MNINITAIKVIVDMLFLGSDNIIRPDDRNIMEIICQHHTDIYLLSMRVSGELLTLFNCSAVSISLSI